MKKFILILSLQLLIALPAISQCEDYAAGPYTDFNPAPCDGQSQEIQEFEVYASEAYLMESAVLSAEYTFSICNGPGVGSWVPDFTIMAPSGAIDAFGEGDGCSISWTASEEGDYLIIINELDSCGISNSIGNGFPMITNVSGGAECPPPAVLIPGAESFEGGELPECWSTVDVDDDGFSWDLLEFDGLAFDGDYSMISYSWVDLPLTPNNYLITPKLELGINDSLYYVVRTNDIDFPSESYAVLVSTTGNAIADFTDEVFSETLFSDEYQGRSIDLSSYDGESVYIAFQHNSDIDQFALNIDAVKLPGTINCNPDGVFNADRLENISIYPNPSNDGLFNVLNSGASEHYTVHVFDISGKEISQERVTLNNGSQYQIDLTSAADGIYTVRFVSTNNTGSLRLVKN